MSSRAIFALTSKASARRLIGGLVHNTRNASRSHLSWLQINHNAVTSTSVLRQFHAFQPFTANSWFKSWMRSRHSDVPEVELREHLTVDMVELKSGVAKDELYVVDVRTPNECADGRIAAKRWVNVPVEELENALALNDKAFLESYGSPKPEKDADDVVFHCRTGVRSTKALGIAQSLGYTKTRHFPDGWVGWEEHLNEAK